MSEDEIKNKFFSAKETNIKEIIESVVKFGSYQDTLLLEEIKKTNKSVYELAAAILKITSELDKNFIKISEKLSEVDKNLTKISKILNE
jgi:hypothetical protein